MKQQNFRIIMFVLIGALFLSISSAYGETAEEYNTRGLAYTKQGDSIPFDAFDRTPNSYYLQAVSDFTKAIEINPKAGDAYFHRSVSYYNGAKDYDKVWADVHKAEELGFDVYPSYIEDLKKDSGKEK